MLRDAGERKDRVIQLLDVLAVFWGGVLKLVFTGGFYLQVKVSNISTTQYQVQHC